MKSNLYFLFFFFALLPVSCDCQNHLLNFNYSEVHNGKNIQLLYRHDFRKTGLALGVKYHINPKLAFYNNNIYLKNTAFANSFVERFGIVGAYYRSISSYKSLFVTSFFYNLQLSRLTLKTLIYEPIFIPSIEETYTKRYATFKPSIFLEQNMGIHLNLKMTEQILLTLEGGVGITIINDTDPKLPKSPIDNFLGLGEWEFSRLLSIGFNYKLK